MKINVSAEALASFVNIVSRAVKPKSNLPVLGNIYIEASEDFLKLIGTDLEVQIVAQLNAKVQKTGKATVNASLFSQYLNTLDKTQEVELSLEKNTLRVSTNSSKAEFATRDPSDFPLFESVSYEKVFDISVDDFIQISDKILFSVAKDDIRPILTGVNIELDKDLATFVTLDTFRLSKFDYKLDKPVAKTKSMVVPSVAFDHVLRVVRDSFVSALADSEVVGISLAKNNNFAKFNYGNVVVYSRLLEGEYPKYKQIIPSEFSLVVNIPREDFLKALKRVGVFAQNAISQKVVLTFKDASVKLESNIPELGSVTEQVPLESAVKKEFKIAFQLRFLSEVIGIISDPSFEFRGISSTAAAMFIQPSLADKYLHLLMPLKLEE